MRKGAILLGSLFLLIILTAFAINKSQPNNDNARQPVNFHPSIFYEKSTFLSGIKTARDKDRKFDKKIVGGIIPHHLLPGFMIADFFKTISKEKPKTIILIGPNHYERGSFKALSSDFGWTTPYGNAYPDLEKIDLLVNDNVVKIDNNVLPGDHAVAGSIPFIKYYIPDAKVVPILLSGFMTLDDVSKLSQSISKITDDNTIVVAPVDFSHYLSVEQADKNDKIILSYIKSFDYSRIMSLNNDFLDSPPSITTLLMVMQTLNAKKISVLQHDNSARVVKNMNEATTSYYSIIFYK